MDSIVSFVLLAIHELGNVDKAAKYTGVPRAKVRNLSRFYGARLSDSTFIESLYDLTAE